MQLQHRRITAQHGGVRKTRSKQWDEALPPGVRVREAISREVFGTIVVAHEPQGAGKLGEGTGHTAHGARGSHASVLTLAAIEQLRRHQQRRGGIAELVDDVVQKVTVQFAAFARVSCHECLPFG